ncbi:MAG: 2-polyprenyl-3-methyl-6-methoxy-1,4-benzoquinone monooxygenase [Burkholderiaceae bacterium]|nr:2-polyprenyl-3-methyl-6-methoxy-1,4-benzoquinone monooxygenase [Burkholderiaceae bacterium]
MTHFAPSLSTSALTGSEAREPRRFIRRHGPLDPFIAELDVALQVLGGGVTASRPNPAGLNVEALDADLDTAAKRHAAGLMRVNHVGEVCAQALYRGQAAAIPSQESAEFFLEAAAEEVDHLGWCAQRLRELDSRPSLLNPLWYAGSFALGMLASRAGSAQSLGFMAETERQVEAHLEGHLTELPVSDVRSRAIVEAMMKDEAKHRVSAEHRGARVLPKPLRSAMRLMAKVMTKTAYRI